MKRTLSCLLVALAFVWSPARPAGENPHEVKPSSTDLVHNVIVTATRVETPDREVASSIIVLTRMDLQRTGKTFVLEALQELAGLSVSENGPSGSAATVMLRGANSEHTLVMLDGVEVNDPISPSRSFDFGHLRVESVERVEVILGPQSPLYGSDALGGVINIISRKGDGRTGFSLSTLAGSYATAAGQAGFSGGSGRMTFALDVSALGSSGFSAAGSSYKGNTEKDGYANLSLAGRVGYTLSERFDFDLILRGALTRTSLDGFGGEGGDDPNSRQDYGMFLAKGQVRALLLRNRWEQRLALSYVSHDRSYDNPVDPGHPLDSERGTYHSEHAAADWQHTLYVHDSNIVTFGLEFQREEGRSDYSYESAWGAGSSVFPQNRADTAGLYVQDQIKLGGRFFAAIGGRFDHHSQFGGAFTYRLAPAYVIESTGTKLKMTLGTGFKSPSLYQLYAPGTLWGPIGNPDLKPETSVGWDAGVEQTFFGGMASFGATYFRNEFRNLIQFDYARGYTNTGRASATGVEIAAAAQFGPGITLRAGFDHTDSLDAATGLGLLRRPRDKFTARLSSSLPRDWDLVLSLAAVGPRDDLAFVNYQSIRTRLKGYALLNAVLTHELSSRTRVFLRLDNILNENYETVYGYGMPRFSIYAGFSVGN